MARIKIPANFIKRTELFKNILAKDTADGGASVILPFMTENSIVLADDDADVDSAFLINKDFEKLNRDSEEETKNRNLLFDPCSDQHKSMVQYLKKFYKNNIAKLGEWDVTVNGNKIVYPADFLAMRLAMMGFIAKHNSFPAGTSPLESFLTENDIDIAQNLLDITAAKTPHDNAKAFSDSAEEKRADRDLLMDPVTDNIEAIGNFLVGHFPKNPNKAGQWGFTIDTSPQGNVKRSGFVNIASQKVLKNLALLETFTNTSSFNINAFRGDTPDGEPTVLVPGQKLLIRRGWGTTTLVNPNGDVKATYDAVFHK